MLKTVTSKVQSSTGLKYEYKVSKPICQYIHDCDTLWLYCKYVDDYFPFPWSKWLDEI